MSSKARDRRGRGMRGPAFQAAARPGGIVRHVPARLTRAQRFDEIALAVMEDVESRLAERLDDRLAAVELAVEEIPVLPPPGQTKDVPLAAWIRATPRSTPRLVLFRRPIENRAATRSDLEALLLTIVVEQVAEHLGIPPSDVHPRYRD